MADNAQVAPLQPAPTTPGAPPQVAKGSSTTDTIEIIKGKIPTALRNVTIETTFTSILLLIIILFIIWCIYKIVIVILRWRKRINARALTTQSKLSPMSPSNPLNDPTNDNEVYTGGQAPQTLPDDYVVYTEAIQNSFKGYADYNQKLTAYYNNVKESPPPDLMDPSVLKPENDDW